MLRNRFSIVITRGIWCIPMGEEHGNKDQLIF